MFKSTNSFIERFTKLLRYLYDNIQYLDFDERIELYQTLNYFRDKIVISKCESYKS